MCRYTFLLPAYKAKFFEEALLSIKNQSFVDFKVLVSDDCSPEPLRPIFDRVCGGDPRFQYRRNETNMGSQSLVSHWNLLVGLCDTEYLVMASDDDRYHPRFLEEMDRLASRYPLVNLYRARVERIDEEGDCFEEDPRYDACQDQLQFLFGMYQMPQIHCLANYMFRTSSLREMSGFVDLPLAWFSDDATLLACSTKGVANTEDILFGFRESGCNISSTKDLSAKTCQMKIDATMRYYDYFMSRFGTAQYQHSKLLSRRSEMVKWGLRDRVREQIDAYRFGLTFSDYHRLCRWMSSRHLLDGAFRRVVFWLEYLRP